MVSLGQTPNTRFHPGVQYPQNCPMVPRSGQGMGVPMTTPKTRHLGPPCSGSGQRCVTDTRTRQGLAGAAIAARITDEAPLLAA